MDELEEAGDRLLAAGPSAWSSESVMARCNPLPGNDYSGRTNNTKTGEKTDKTTSDESREDSADKSRESFESDKG